MLMDFAARLLGRNPFEMDGSGNPVAAPDANTAAVAAPALGQYEQDLQAARWDKLGQMGMLLMAAGQPMTAQQRSALIAQAPGMMGGAERDAMNAAQARLYGMHQRQAQDEADRLAKQRERMSDPQLLQRLGVSQDLADILGPDGTRDYVQKKLTTGTGHWASPSELPSGVDPKNPIWIGPDGQPKAVGAGGTTINNAVNPILQGVGKQFEQGMEAAKGAANTIATLNTAREQLDATGGIISGTGADAKLDFAKAARLWGVDDPRIQNTETFRSAIKPVVLSTLSGLGAGNGISNSDREFAEKAVGGNINLDEASIRRILEITDRAARAKIDSFNKSSDQMVKMSPELSNVSPMLHVEMPPAYQPRPQPPMPQGMPNRQPGAANAAPAMPSGPVRVMDKAQYDQLPAGAQYIDPQGNLRTKGGF